MDSKIFIPKLCKVGFNPRQDTYTGFLGYVIYNDGKVWRKEPSWKSWIYEYIDEVAVENMRREQYEQRVKHRLQYGQSKYENGKWVNYPYVDRAAYEAEFPYEEFEPSLGQFSVDPKIKPFEFTNEPIEGFVLNKKAGGYSTGWNHRQTYCRVYDPRGFEIEVSIPNLLYVLDNASCIKGKGLEGKFVYGWDGKDLLLIPEEAPEFKQMLAFTDIKNQKSLGTKDLIVGNTYLFSDLTENVYLGKYYVTDYYGIKDDSKSYLFIDVDNIENFLKDPVYYYGNISSYSGLSKVKQNSGQYDQFNDILDKMLSQKHWSEIPPEYKKVKTLDLPVNGNANFTVFIKDGKKFKKHSVQYYSNYRAGYYGVGNGSPKFEFYNRDYNRESYSTLSELLNKYELWQQIKTD